jgi:hypothetical protein
MADMVLLKRLPRIGQGDLGLPAIGLVLVRREVLERIEPLQGVGHTSDLLVGVVGGNGVRLDRRGLEVLAVGLGW